MEGWVDSNLCGGVRVSVDAHEKCIAMSELILPISLWNGPPPHSVTSILLILERSVLVTGSSSGQLCIWSIETEKVLVFPHLLLKNNPSTGLMGL
jgi:hypothetical protein